METLISYIINVVYLCLPVSGHLKPGQASHLKPGQASHLKPGQTGHLKPGQAGHLKGGEGLCVICPDPEKKANICSSRSPKIEVGFSMALDQTGAEIAFYFPVSSEVCSLD
uniref:Uncharacterized protein n=1 Tax=Parascaris equorum TaxID=6256 RepID=A0A914R6W5_PAREQ